MTTTGAISTLITTTTSITTETTMDLVSGDNYYHQEGPHDYYGGYDPTPPGLLSIGVFFASIYTDWLDEA